jgi:hypothetical protein
MDRRVGTLARRPGAYHGNLRQSGMHLPGSHEVRWELTITRKVMTMLSMTKYREIIENYLNGNIADFQKQIRALTKKEILTIEWQMINGYNLDANHILHKHL